MVNVDNSKRLNVHTWSDHPEVNSFVYKLWDKEFAQVFPTHSRGRKSRAKPKYQFKVLILDLYVAWKQDPSLMLGVEMSPNAYNESSIYNALHISRIMLKLVSQPMSVSADTSR